MSRQTNTNRLTQGLWQKKAANLCRFVPAGLPAFFIAYCALRRQTELHVCTSWEPEGGQKLQSPSPSCGKKRKTSQENPDRQRAAHAYLSFSLLFHLLTIIMIIYNTIIDSYIIFLWMDWLFSYIVLDDCCSLYISWTITYTQTHTHASFLWWNIGPPPLCPSSRLMWLEWFYTL